MRTIYLLMVVSVFGGAGSAGFPGDAEAQTETLRLTGLNLSLIHI